MNNEEKQQRKQKQKRKQEQEQKQKPKPKQNKNKQTDHLTKKNEKMMQNMKRDTRRLNPRFQILLTSNCDFK